MAARSSAPGGVGVGALPAWAAPASHWASEPMAGPAPEAGAACSAAVSSSVMTTTRRAGNGVPTARILSHCSAWLTMSMEASQSARM